MVIPHREAQSHIRIATLVALLALLSGCSLTENDPATAARGIGDAEVPERNLTLTITPGAFREVGSTEARLRSAAPVAQLGVSGGPLASGSYALNIGNLHKNARPEVLSISFSSAADTDGCPEVSRDPISCVAATESMGDPCSTGSDCPAGLTCIDSQCEPATSFDLCTPPTVEDSPEPGLTFSTDVQPCTLIRYDLAIQDDDTPLRFVAIGSTDSLETLREALEAASELDPEPDFIVLLGENIEDSNLDGLDALEASLNSVDIPKVYVAGSRAVDFDEGAPVLRRLGPHDQTFALKGVRFVSFFSARRGLGERGFQRLETFLRQLERLPEGPSVALTHTIPLDPNGIRDQGFKSRIEGARTVSLLEEFGVDYLLSGRIPSNEAGALGTMEAWITSAESNRLRTNSSFLFIEAPRDFQELRISEHNF